MYVHFCIISMLFVILLPVNGEIKTLTITTRVSNIGIESYHVRLPRLFTPAVVIIKWYN